MTHIDLSDYSKQSSIIQYTKIQNEHKAKVDKKHMVLCAYNFSNKLIIHIVYISFLKQLKYFILLIINKQINKNI